MPSTVTTPAGTRIPNDDATTLRELASRDGVTVSALISRIIGEALPKLTAER